MNSLGFIDATTQTVRGAAQYLARNGAGVGLTGFFLGGAVTIIGTDQSPRTRGRRRVLWHPAGAGRKPSDIRIPLQAHFANKDGWCTPRWSMDSRAA
jgi:carboxymethylenebutenolidase